MFRHLWFAVIGLVALAWPISAGAETCDCSSRVAQLPRKRASLEFWGEALSNERLPGRQKVSFHVLQQYMGGTVQTVDVYFVNPCPPKMQPGKTYFVRAHDRHQQKYSGFYTNGCAGTRQVDEPPSEGSEPVDHGPLTREFDGRLEPELAQIYAVCREEDTKPGDSADIFRLTLAPDDDPLLEKPEFDDQTACLTRELLERMSKLHPDDPILVDGTVGYRGEYVGVVAAWQCTGQQPCRTFADAISEELLEVVVPLTEKQARVLAKQMNHATDGDPSIDIARTLCPIDGIDAAKSFAENNKLVGGPKWQAELDTTLFQCAVVRGDFDRARALLEQAKPGPAFEIALDWAAGHKTHQLPMRQAEPTLLPSVDEAAVSVRQHFAHAEGWSNDPLWLEAFAEAVVADPEAPLNVRRLGALAYHKAALLRANAATHYEAFARELADDDEIAEPLAILRERFEQQARANEARTAIAARAQRTTPQEQLDLEREPPPEVDAVADETASDASPDEPSFDWWSLAKHLLVIVGSLSLVAFLASQGSRRR